MPLEYTGLEYVGEVHRNEDIAVFRALNDRARELFVRNPLSYKEKVIRTYLDGRVEELPERTINDPYMRDRYGWIFSRVAGASYPAYRYEVPAGKTYFEVLQNERRSGDVCVLFLALKDNVLGEYEDWWVEETRWKQEMDSVMLHVCEMHTRTK